MRTSLLILSASILCTFAAYAQRWEKVDVPAPYDKGYYLDIFFLESDPQKGWACDNDSGYVIRTVDGGDTWQGTRVVGAGETCHLEYIQFFDNNIGYSSGPCGIFKSVDGGANWNRIDLPSQVFAVWGGWFKNSNEGWFTGGGCGYGAFLKTVDGGNSFTVYIDTNQLQSNLSDPLWQSDMANGEVIAIGNGTLWESDDDGDTWSVRSLTGPTEPWHEEISRFNSTIMVSNARTNCPNGTYTGGGIRTSRDDGRNWTNFETGADMFGVYLIDDQEAWAAGWAGNVWQTTNAGRDWTLQNCGIGRANMDDIFFIDKDRGWVVGDGLYRLAGAKREVTRDTLFFETVCPDSADFDTVYVINSNLASSLWKWQIIADPDSNFVVDNVQPTDIPACDSIPIAVRYIGKTMGRHEGGLEIQFFDPDTTVIVHLVGRRGGLDAAPRDTLYEYYQRVGEPLDKVVFWQSSSAPLETITEVELVRGNPNIKLWASLPLEVPVKPSIVQMLVSAEPQDTGWMEAVYRIRLEPCGRDTFITLRVYGMAPIFNSTSIENLNIGCGVDTVFSIPIWNTGNEVLSMSDIRTEGPNAPAFTIEGFVSGLTGPPWRVNPGGSDTLRVRYTPETGNDVVSLVIEHDDNTTTRGITSPWTIALNGRSDRPQFTIDPAFLDLGELCVGEKKDTAFVFTNDGGQITSAMAENSSGRFEGFSTSPASIRSRAQRIFRFQWSASTPGLYEDTVNITVFPCDTSATVIVRAVVNESSIDVTPNPLDRVTTVGVPIRETIAVTANGNSEIRIETIRLVPGTNNVQTFLPGLPLVLQPGQTTTFDVEWVSANPASITERVEVTGTGTCEVVGTGDITFRANSDEVSVSTSRLTYRVECEAETVLDTIIAESRADIDVTMGIPDMIAGTAFTVVSPTTQTLLAPGETVEVVVAYDPTVESPATGRLQLGFSPSGENVFVDLEGEFATPDIEVTPLIIDLGSHGTCEDTLMRAITITNNGTLDETVVLERTGLPTGVAVGPGTLNVPAGETRTAFLVYDPTLAPLGVLSAQINITGTTCGFAETIQVSAVTVGGKLEMTPNPVLVPMQNVNTSIIEVVTINNPSTEDRRIVSLEIAPPSAEWTLLDNVDGRDVPSGASIDVRVRYTSPNEGRHLATLELTDVGACETSSSITLDGSSRIEPAFVLQIGVDRYSVLPFSQVSIPVEWETDISDATPQVVDFTLEYSKVLFVVDSVTSTYPHGTVNATIQPGRIDVEASGTTPLFGSPGEILVMHGTANPAIPDSTTIDVVPGEVVSIEPTTIEDRDGLLHVQNCGPYNAIALTGPTRVIIAPPQPSSDAVNLAIHAAYDEILTIELYDMAGNLVGGSSGHLAPRGSSLLRVELEDMVTGQYLVRVLTNHGGEFNLRCLVVK